MQADLADVIAAAEQEAERMASIARQAERGDTVTMHVEQFQKLSEIISTLCRSLNHEDDQGMGSPRYWVPLDVFKNLKEKYDTMQSERENSGDFILR